MVFDYNNGVLSNEYKIHPRTFHIDPSGRMLVAQHNLPVDVRDGDNVQTV